MDNLNNYRAGTVVAESTTTPGMYFSVLVCIILLALSGWVLLFFVGNFQEFLSEIDSSVIVPLLLMLVMFIAFLYGLKKFISILISSVTLYHDHLSFNYLATFSFKVIRKKVALNEVNLYFIYGAEQTRYGNKRYNILVVQTLEDEYKFPYKTTKSIETLCAQLQQLQTSSTNKNSQLE